MEFLNAYQLVVSLVLLHRHSQASANDGDSRDSPVYSEQQMEILDELLTDVPQEKGFQDYAFPVEVMQVRQINVSDDEDLREADRWSNYTRPLPCAVRYPITEVDIMWQRSTYSTVLPVMLTLCLLSSFANFYVLLAVRYIRRIHSPTLCFSISLAAANAVASIVLAMGLLINSYLNVIYGLVFDHFMCYVLTMEAVRYGTMLTNVTHLLALAINHYIGIVKPLHYQAIVTKRLALTIIGVSWALPTLALLLYFSVIQGQAFLSRECENYFFLVKFRFRFAVVFCFCLFLIIMCFFYAHIFYIVRGHHIGLQQYKTSSSAGATSGNSQQDKDMTSNVKAVVTTLLILGTYMLGWMPAVVHFILTCEDCLFCFTDHYKINVSIAITINSLMIFKYLVDPIIYCMRIREIRDGIKRLHFEVCGVGTPPPNTRLGSRGTSTYLTSVRSPSRFTLRFGNGSSDQKRRATLASMAPFGSGEHRQVEGTSYNQSRDGGPEKWTKRERDGSMSNRSCNPAEWYSANMLTSKEDSGTAGEGRKLRFSIKSQRRPRTYSIV